MVSIRVVFFSLFLVAGLIAPGWAQTTVIQAGRLIDPASGSVLTDQLIRIERGIITGLGADVAYPEDATVIDLSTATVFPGLMDAHTHLCLNVRLERDNGRYYYTSLQDPDAARAIDGVVNALSMLESGFTTVRDIGNEGNYACTAVRVAIEEGRVPGPTMINAGRIIAPFGGQFTVPPHKRYLAEPEYFFADTRDEMVKAIRENIHFGAGVIKIVVDDQEYIYSIDDIRFMKEEAARAGRKLAAHAWTPEGAHNAAAAGVASIEHLWNVRDEDLDLARENGVIAVFTPFPDLEWSAQRPLTDEELAREHAHQIDRLSAGIRSGIPIAYGTDAITSLPGQTRGSLAIQRIDMYLEAGMSPLELLKAMTITPARLFGVDATRGAIAVGLAADIVATAANPLDDPQELKRPVFIMKNGQVIK